MRKKCYFDMDGTIAKWQDIPLEVIAAPGYFKNVPVIESMCHVVTRLIKESHTKNSPEIFILSSVFQDDHSVDDKKYWLRVNLPEMDEDHMIFVPYGEKKSSVIKEPNSSDILVDDFTFNLKSWHGVGIKVYNGINGTHGTWDGYSIHSNMNPELLYRQLKGIIENAA